MAGYFFHALMQHIFNVTYAMAQRNGQLQRVTEGPRQRKEAQQHMWAMPTMRWRPRQRRLFALDARKRNQKYHFWRS